MSSSTMRRPIVLFASLLVYPLVAMAAVGPEQRLTSAESRLSRKSTVMFDGRNFLVAWTDTLSSGQILPASFALVDGNGAIIGRPSIATGPSYDGPPTLASDGQNTLVVWLEERKSPFGDSPPSFDLRITWADAEGRQVRGVVTVDTFTGRVASVDAVSTSTGFVIAYSTEEVVNAVRILALSFGGSGSVRVKQKTTGQRVRVSADETILLLWEQEPECPPDQQCPTRSVMHGRQADLMLQPRSTEFQIAGDRLKALMSISSFQYVAATDTPTSWSLHRFDGSGLVLAERTAQGVTAPALAQLINETFVFFQRPRQSTGSDLFFLPLNSELLLTRDIRDDQALTLSAEDESEYDVSVAGAGRKALAVYTRNEGAGSLVAYRLVDASSLGSPPATPAAPVVVASSATNRARVTLQWQETAGARRYRVLAFSRERNDSREIVVNGNNRTAIIDDLHPETEYEFRLIAEDANGISSPSSILRVTTARQSTPPPPPPPPPVTKRRAVRP